MRYLRSALIASFLLTPACGGGDASPSDGGGADARDGGREGGRDAAVLVTHAYTPAGCDYSVATPEVLEAGASADTFGAAPTADHVHVSWAGPTHSTFAVNWRSDEGTLASQVLYGTDEAAVRAADAADGTAVLGQRGHHLLYGDLLAPDERTRIHEVHVCGLAPSTVYYYKVGGPGHWSEVFHTATGPAIGAAETWSFAVAGDSRNNEENAWPVAARRIRDHAVDLQLFTGDAVMLGALQTDWNDWFEGVDGATSVEDVLSEIPLMAVNGNHDALAVNYVAQFAFPQEVSDGEGATGEEWYSFDYGNAHFVMLNDTVVDEDVLAGEQATWLRADLAAVNRAVTPWVFVSHHRAFYTCESEHSPDRDLRAAWQPIFDEHRVDMVFVGHNHVYERSLPIRGLSDGEGVVAASGSNGEPTIDGEGNPSGTVYVLAAGVGAPLYDVADTCAYTRTALSARSYAVIQITGRTLAYTAYFANDGAVIGDESFTYTK